MTEIPTLGPIAGREEIGPFLRIAEAAHDLFETRVASQGLRRWRPVEDLFRRMAYQAKTTSFGIRLLNSWGHFLPAFSLLRTRLEQTIVCSYLIHEEIEIGLKPFVKYLPITDHRLLKAAMADHALASDLVRKFDADSFEQEATAAQADLTPGFTLVDGKFQRNWTSLDLRSMARRRDELALAKASIPMDRLEREYLSIYKVASSVVHGDCASLSYRFLGVFPSPSGGSVLMTIPSWGLIVAASLARYDLLQCSEVSEYIGCAIAGDYDHLRHQWNEARDRFI